MIHRFQENRPMQFLWNILSFCLIFAMYICTCNWLTNRITNGGKFGRVIEVATTFIVTVLLVNLISVIAILLGVESYNLQNVPLIGPVVMATVSALVLLFLMRKLTKKRRPIEGSEFHSK